MREAFGVLNVELQDELGRRCPQLREIFPELGIKDVRDYGYNYCWDGEGRDVKIENETYYVKDERYVEKLEEMMRLPEVMRLSLSAEVLDRIYELYCKIVEDKDMLEKAKKISYFNYAYVEHISGKTFVKMDRKNSIVATMAFCLYH
jgi:hypothetical protein